jgi:hypothetical protein
MKKICEKTSLLGQYRAEVAMMNTIRRQEREYFSASISRLMREALESNDTALVLALTKVNTLVSYDNRERDLRNKNL